MVGVGVVWLLHLNTALSDADIKDTTKFRDDLWLDDLGFFSLGAHLSQSFLSSVVWSAACVVLCCQSWLRSSTWNVPFALLVAFLLCSPTTSACGCFLLLICAPAEKIPTLSIAPKEWDSIVTVGDLKCRIRSQLEVRTGALARRGGGMRTGALARGGGGGG